MLGCPQILNKDRVNDVSAIAHVWGIDRNTQPKSERPVAPKRLKPSSANREPARYLSSPASVIGVEHQGTAVPPSPWLAKKRAQ